MRIRLARNAIARTKKRLTAVTATISQNGSRAPKHLYFQYNHGCDSKSTTERMEIVESKVSLLPTCPDVKRARRLYLMRAPKYETLMGCHDEDGDVFCNVCYKCPSAGECTERKVSRLADCPGLQCLEERILDTAFPDPNDPRRNDLDLVGRLFDEVVKQSVGTQTDIEVTTETRN